MSGLESPKICLCQSALSTCARLGIYFPAFPLHTAYLQSSISQCFNTPRKQPLCPPLLVLRPITVLSQTCMQADKDPANFRNGTTSLQANFLLKMLLL